MKAYSTEKCLLLAGLCPQTFLFESPTEYSVLGRKNAWRETKDYYFQTVKHKTKWNATTLVMWMPPYSRRVEMLTFLLGPCVQKLLEGLPVACLWPAGHIFFTSGQVYGNKDEYTSRSMLANKMYGFPTGSFTWEKLCSSNCLINCSECWGIIFNWPNHYTGSLYSNFSPRTLVYISPQPSLKSIVQPMKMKEVWFSVIGINTSLMSYIHY